MYVIVMILRCTADAGMTILLWFGQNVWKSIAANMWYACTCRNCFILCSDLMTNASSEWMYVYFEWVINSIIKLFIVYLFYVRYKGFKCSLLRKPACTVHII